MFCNKFSISMLRINIPRRVRQIGRGCDAFVLLRFGHSKVSLEKKSNLCKKNLAIAKEISYTVILVAGIILQHDSQKRMSIVTH